jgi:hypothetical protein
MFEKLEARAGRRARERAVSLRDALAERLERELPAGVAAERVDEGVEVSGRGLRRRLALDARLRWLATGSVL